MIKCQRCKELKSPEEFHNSKNSPDGKVEWCKLCAKEYRKKHYKEQRKLAGFTSMFENKNSPGYLGIVIGERLCQHLFKDVIKMPNNNPGFDIICNQGKMIDIKTACSRLSGKYLRWHFNIYKNKVANFFLCIAFDNRKNLTPLHIWMIPSDKINDKGNITIRNSTLHKWIQYERSIEELQICCITMKSDVK